MRKSLSSPGFPGPRGAETGVAGQISLRNLHSPPKPVRLHDWPLVDLLRLYIIHHVGEACRERMRSEQDPYYRSDSLRQPTNVRGKSLTYRT
jgi:hypothetical protein